jgi:hypothetical protein
MSTDGSEQVVEETPVVKLRRRLSNVPEVQAKYGLPNASGPQQRARADSAPTVLDPQNQEKVRLAEEQKVKAAQDQAAKDKAAADVDQGISDLDLDLFTFGQFKIKASPQDLSEIDRLKKKAVVDKQIVDPVAAVVALGNTHQEMSRLHEALKDKIEVETRALTSGQAVDKLKKAASAPKYDGKNILKNTGEKEFTSDVAKPVDRFMGDVETKVKARQLLTEAEQVRLLELSGMVAKYGEKYAEKQAGLEKEKDKHPNEYKLYVDYVRKCKEIGDELGALERNNIPDELRLLRERKRELEKGLAQYDKTHGLWKRLDKKTYDKYADVRGEFNQTQKGIFNGVTDQSAPDELKNAAAKVDLLTSDVNQKMREMFGSKAAMDQLDKAVDDMGSKADSSADKEFVKEAFKARFNVEVFEGEISKTNVMAFYKTFKMVPDSHTKGNEWLTNVNRKKSLGDVTSSYDAPDKGPGVKPRGEVAIRAMRTSGPVEMVQNDIVAPMIFSGVDGNKKINQFTWVTLHEIGHAVDHADDFMSNGTNNGLFGDWKSHGFDEIKGLIKKKLLKAFPKYPADFVAAYVERVCANKPLKDADRDELAKKWGIEMKVALTKPKDKNGLLNDDGLKSAEAARLKFEQDGWNDDATKKARSDAEGLLKVPTMLDIAMRILERVLGQKKPLAAAVDDVLDSLPDSADLNAEPDWDGLKKADILRWYKSACLVEPKGVLDGIKQMTGAACWIRSAEYPIDDRIYHESYKGKWVSYALKARQDKLTDYQYRAAGEFFAESYAAFFMKKLRPGDILDAIDALQKKEALKN